MGRWLGCVALALVVAISGAWGSVVVTPILGARDAALQGNTVAAPYDGPSILLYNPAGVADIEGTELSVGNLVAPVSGRYQAPRNEFDEKSSELAMVPTIWFGSGRLAPWHLGVGMRAIVGSSFNFHSSPTLPPPNGWYLGEQAVVQADFVAGRQLGSKLKVGVQAGPTYGKIRSRYPSPVGAVSIDGDGFGVGAGIGALYQLEEHTTVGLSYRSPGITWIRGGGEVGTQDDNFSVNFHTPQAIAVAVAYRLTPSLTLMAQTRWTDYPELEKSRIRFNGHPELDQNQFAGTRARFRYGAAVEFQWTDAVILRSGIAHEDWMMKPESLSPLLYDTADTGLGIGMSVRANRRWTVDLAFDYGLHEDRVVTGSQNSFFPGRYSLDTMSVTVLVTYHFAVDASSR